MWRWEPRAHVAGPHSHSLWTTEPGLELGSLASELLHLAWQINGEGLRAPTRNSTHETSDNAGQREVFNFQTSKISYFLLMVAKPLTILKFPQGECWVLFLLHLAILPVLKPKDTWPSLVSSGPCLCSAQRTLSPQDENYSSVVTKYRTTQADGTDLSLRLSWNDVIK